MENAYLIPLSWDELSLNNGLFNVRFKYGIKFNFKTQGNKMFEDQTVITSVFLKACRNTIFFKAVFEFCSLPLAKIFKCIFQSELPLENLPTSFNYPAKW